MNKQAIQCMHFAQAIASRPDFGSKNCTKLGSLRVLKRGSILSAFEKYNHPEVIGKFLNILYVSPLDTVRFLFFPWNKKESRKFLQSHRNSCHLASHTYTSMYLHAPYQRPLFMRREDFIRLHDTSCHIGACANWISQRKSYKVFYPAIFYRAKGDLGKN